MKKELLRVWQTSLDILFPPICLGCQSNLLSDEEKENLLCNTCFNGVKIYSNIVKPDPLFSLLAVSSYENTALRELIHYFKYNGFLAAQAPLEKLIIKWLDANSSLVSSILDSSFCLIPIPLHKKRLRERGFNQAEIIGQILSRHLNIPLEKNLLERVRDTKSQIKMKGAQRREENVRGSIRIREEDRSPQCQNIILVDDIYTSGATMKEAAGALHRAGAKNIVGFTMART